MDKRVRNLIIFLGIALFIYSIWIFRSIVSYILISAALSILGQPVVNFLQRIKYGRFYLPRALCAGLTLILFWVFIGLFFRYFIPIILAEANELSEIDFTKLITQLDVPLQKLQPFLIKIGAVSSEASIIDNIKDKLAVLISPDFFSNLFSQLTSMIGSLVVAIFVISFITFFFLKDANLFNEGIMALVPDKHIEEVENILHKIRVLLSHYLAGILLDVFIIMTLVTFGLWLVGIEFHHAIICGLLSGIMNVIPYVGPWIGAAFSIAIGVATNIDLPFEAGLMPLVGYMLLVFVITQILDWSVFQPFIYSKSVNAHPLEIFLVILMAGSLAGIGGMVLAIPSYTVIRVIAKEFFSSFKVVQKLTKNI
jgi:predicted PurR-regulated permease PerM